MAEIELIKKQTEDFLNSWKRHGKDLLASYTIQYDHFVILAVDEAVSDVSGCAIDASVNLIKKLENTFSIDLTNKLYISFKDSDNINIVTLAQFKDFAAQGKISGDTIVFNNLITTKEELDKDWEIKAGQSWHKRFL
jgi:hypothetical protein